jgi:hypothetical protein
MYKVKVLIQPKNTKRPEEHYQKTCYDGIYISKEKEAEASTVKKDVWNYLEPRIKGKPGMTFELISISITKLPRDFVVCEK